MAKPPSSPYKLNDGPPQLGFEQKFRARLELQYRIDGDLYVFDYRSKILENGDTRSLSEEIRDIPFITFAKKGIQDGEQRGERVELDLDIKNGDTLVEVVTVPNEDGLHPDLYWSRIYHAVQTKISRKKFYGQLEYTDDGMTWEDFTSYHGTPERLARRMRFKARLNSVAGEKHRFSFFVILKDKDNNLVEYEIDPDIKNPST